MKVREVPEYTLTREAVVACADEAIRGIRELTEKTWYLSRAEVDGLMAAARTCDEFAIGGWYIDGRCGCLVGNLVGQAIDEYALSDGLYEVGWDFDRLLRQAVVASGDRSAGAVYEAVVKVES